MPDLDFDQAIAVLGQWVGRRVRVQVAAAEVVAHAEGELQPRKPSGGEGVAIFELDRQGNAGLWLWREHVTRALWINNAQTVLGFETQGVILTVGLDAPGEA